MSKFQSTKKLGPISTCHRNWVAHHNPNRDSRKCALIHGYSRYIQFTFEGDLDQHQWVFDFGDCKFIKQWLEDNWDHRVLVSASDPRLDELKELSNTGLIALTVIPTNDGWGPGIEGSCKWVFDTINPQILDKTQGRVKIAKIEIWEHENNSASYINEN